MDKNFSFNIMNKGEGGIGYDPERQHGARTDLFVAKDKANEAEKTVLKNMLNGTISFKGASSLLASAEAGTLEESELANSLDAFTKGVDIARHGHIHPLVNGVGGRIRYLLSEEAANLDGEDVFIEVDKIVKDLSYYEKISPDDVLLEKEGNKIAIHKIISELQGLLDLYVESNNAKIEPIGIEVEVRGKSGTLNDGNFKNQAVRACAEANDIMMDLEASVVSENFSEMNILLGELSHIKDKAQLIEKLTLLKSLIERELSQ